MDDVPRRWLIEAGRAALWHRRLLAAGLAAAAVALIIHAAQPTPPATTPVLVAARDLPGGATLTDADLATADVLPETVPDGALPDVSAGLGRLLAGPVRAGEPITDVRLTGPSLVDGWGDDLVAVPVRIADPGVVTMVRPGDRIDLIAASMDGHTEAGVLAAQVPLLAVPAPADGGLLADGALLVVAVPIEQAAALAQAAVTSRLSVALR
ncbi:MAG TPA: SAF domain-containing protein [Jiangellaceae bacterium]|nr:SAF domain-containing protein [Jiangellaceae bacterium]